MGDGFMTPLEMAGVVAMLVLVILLLTAVPWGILVRSKRNLIQGIRGGMIDESRPPEDRDTEKGGSCR